MYSLTVIILSLSDLLQFDLVTIFSRPCDPLMVSNVNVNVNRKMFNVAKIA